MRIRKHTMLIVMNDAKNLKLNEGMMLDKICSYAWVNFRGLREAEPPLFKFPFNLGGSAPLNFLHWHSFSVVAAGPQPKYGGDGA